MLAVPYLIDQYAQTILTDSHDDQFGTDAALYAVPVLPGSQRYPPNGFGQLACLGSIGLATTGAVLTTGLGVGVTTGAVLTTGAGLGSGRHSESSSQ